MKHSIKEVDKVFDTNGSNPVLVLCDDFNDYVVKYQRSPIATALFNEHIGASFLKIWDLHVPDFDLVIVDRAHIEKLHHSRIQPHYFDSPCFGSKFSRDFNDFTQLVTSSPSSGLKKFVYKDELLKIALFDIWVSNEDRNFQNTNLMYDLRNGNRFVPIDHVLIFSGSNLKYGLSQLTFNDSILSFNGMKILFKKKELLDSVMIEGLKEKYYLCIETCNEKLDQIVASVPEEWNIHIEETTRLIRARIFNERWIDESWINFISFIQYVVKH